MLMTFRMHRKNPSYTKETKSHPHQAPFIVVNHCRLVPPETQLCNGLVHLDGKSKPVKALGPRGWLVGTADHAPPGLHVFNGSPVLLKLLPPKQSQGSSPLLARPKPSKQASQKNDSNADPIQGQFDPCANWQGPKPAANAKPSTGPTEQRCKAQD